jgi:hypothetical protein
MAARDWDGTGDRLNESDEGGRELPVRSGINLPRAFVGQNPNHGIAT